MKSLNKILNHIKLLLLKHATLLNAFTIFICLISFYFSADLMTDIVITAICLYFFFGYNK